MRRLVALALPIFLFAAVLSGCTKDPPASAAEWLAQQPGVTEAQILTGDTGQWSSGALIRGELDPGIRDVQLRDLRVRITEYQAAHGPLGFWLGMDQVDFVVGEGDPAAVDSLWRQVSDIPGVVSAIVADHDVRVRTLRGDAVVALEALDRLEGSVRLEAFADDTALAADAILDLRDDRVNPAAIEYRRPARCTVDAAVLGFATSLLGRDDIPAATVDLCTGITIDIPADGSVARQALAVRAELDERGLAEFPVQLTSRLDGSGTVHFAAITPGDAAVLPVLAVFEQPDAPPVSYSLGLDGTLAVTAYDVPTVDLLALVQGSPAAARLAGVGIEGDPVAVVSPPDRLPALLEEALELDAASGTFGSVQLGLGFGAVTLEAGPGTEPDVDAAVAALRATGSVERRFFSVRYLTFQADIANGVAALTDPGYVGADVMRAFVDAWNG